MKVEFDYERGLLFIASTGFAIAALIACQPTVINVSVTVNDKKSCSTNANGKVGELPSSSRHTFPMLIGVLILSKSDVAVPRIAGSDDRRS